MKSLSPLALVVLIMSSCVGCIAGLRTESNLRSAAQKRALTVQINTRCSRYSYQGSGVVISKTEILTAAHVIDCAIVEPITGMLIPNGSPIEIIAAQPDGIGRRLLLVRADVTRDVARLRIADAGEFYDVPDRATFAVVRPEDRVCVSVGRPMRDLRCGTVDERFGRPADDLSLSFPVEPGNSGSGVYDRRGRLVGIITKARMMRNGQSAGALATSLGEQP